MATIYTATYSKAFDDFYPVPDYSLDLMQSGMGLSRPCRILDLGCGTGRNASQLVAAGHMICGVDSSGPMLQQMSHKLPGQRWINDTIERFEADSIFDGAIMLGDIISYHLASNSVIRALRNVRKHLRIGARMLLDAWYGPAVLIQRPGYRKVALTDITREASSILDLADNICVVEYKFKCANGKEQLETHQMRYFFQPELRLFLELTGFRTVSIGRREDYTEPATEDDWHILVQAEAV